MNYNKNLFIDNIYYLAKQRKIKIGELESLIGVSTGYFARLRQGEKNVAPGADSLLTAADLLSVSVDALLTFDFSQTTEAESSLHQYLEKLLRETQSHKLIWREDLFGYLDNLLINPDGTTPHPLFSTHPVSGEKDFDPFYFSRFRPDLECLVPVDTYGCIMPDSKTLYLVQVLNTGEDPASPGEWTELELFLTGPRKDAIPFCHTNHEAHSSLDIDLKRLFGAVRDSVTLPHLTPEAQAYISDYLKEERNADEAK